MIDSIRKLLADQASLLDYECTGISKDQLHLPGPDFIDRVVAYTDRSPQVMASLQRMYNTGRMAGTGFISILPVDQGIEHSGAASFAPNPIYFDPENIVKLAVEGGCNAVASTLGVLGSVSRKYAHKIPFLVKINHNEMLTYPNDFDQTLWASVEQAWNLGAAAIGATIYYGSENCRRQIMEISDAFQQAHELGMFTVRRMGSTTMRRPISPVRPTTSASPSRPTSSSRSRPPTTAGTLRLALARRARWSTRSWFPTTPSSSPGGRWSTATWAVQASSTLVARRATMTSPRRSPPRSSTSAPAAWV